MNKRGSIEDVALLAVILFTSALILTIGYFAFGTTIDKLLTSSVTNSTPRAVTVWQDTKTNLMSKFDYVVMGIFVALSLGIIVSAYFVRGRPEFMFFYFIALAIIVVVASIIAYVWSIFSAGNAISNYVGNAMFITNHLLLYLPLYVCAIGLTGMAVMFISPRY